MFNNLYIYVMAGRNVSVPVAKVQVPLIDLFGGGRMVGKLSYFRPHEGFLREYSHSYTTDLPAVLRY